MDKVILQPAQIRLRHVKLGASTDQGAVQVLGQWFSPQDRADLNSNRNRFGAGSSYVRREGMEGEFTLVFPNTPANRARFAIIANRTSYRPGDEWIEIYETTGADPVGDVLLVGTPTKALMTRATITLTGYDALWTEKKQRETDAGFWCHAPHDVFEGYSRGWTSPLADDFTTTGRFSYSTTTPQYTVDGKWGYEAADEDPAYPGMLRMHTTSAAVCEFWSQAQPLVDSPTSRWRVELNLGPITPTASGYMRFQLEASSGLLSPPYEILIEWSTTTTFTVKCVTYDNVTGAAASVLTTATSLPTSLAIERHGRWAFFYYNGTLVAVISTSLGSYSLGTDFVVNPGAAGTMTVYVDSILIRQALPYLQAAGVGGDLRLPATTLAAGGLQGTYFDDHDVAAAPTSFPNSFERRILSPVRDKQGGAAVVLRRLDPALSFANVAAFNVPVANGEYFSARYTGAIFLDLDNYDYAFRETSDDRARVWIGKTRWGEQIIDDWTAAGHGATTSTSTWLKAGSSAGSAPSGTSGPLAGERSGWYPIVVEYSNSGGGASFVLEQERSDAAGTWATPIPAVLSPYGIVNTQVSGDSHYEQLIALKSGWAVQFTCQPKTLESGEFPGRLIPVVREGHDTDLIIDSFDGTAPQTQIDAEDTTDTLRCDAQGLADPNGASQLTREGIDYTQIGKHMLINSEYESLSDITYAPLLEQRARSLIALRSSPYEEIQVQPASRRGLTDSFPLTGTLAKMNWLPGDAARLKLPELAIDDQTPRQMVEISWVLRPSGRSRPAVKWRQRVRNFEQLFRKTARVALNSDRNYQGQLVAVAGALGSSAGGGGSDEYSRVGLPANLADVKRATLVVQGIAGTWTIEINGTSTGQPVSAPGRYDVSPYIAKGAGSQQMYARLITGGAAYQVTLELLVAV